MTNYPAKYLLPGMPKLAISYMRPLYYHIPRYWEWRCCMCSCDTAKLYHTEMAATTLGITDLQQRQQ